MNAANIVTIRELTKIYQQGEIRVTALDRISLDIQQGEFLSLMGPSGSGKSTLLYIIAGVDRPTSGEVRVRDVDLTRLNGKQRREQVRTALELVGLADRHKHLPGQLSGGQEQRVAIARALVTDPPLIVADEPTGNLDSQSAQEVLSILQRLSHDIGKTVILVTHDPKAASYGSRAIH